MKITGVRTMLLRGPDPHGIGGHPRSWSVLLVRVDTDAGPYGLGEAPAMFGVREAIGYCGAWLMGKDPLRVGAFSRAMLYGGLPPEDPQMSPTATPTGPIAWAVSGVEMALHDLMGKALDTPVVNLLGGAVRDRVRIYLDRSGVADPTDLESWRALARRSIGDGFTDFKFDVEHIAPELTRDSWNRAMRLEQLNAVRDRLTAVREATGWDAEIALDGHMSYDVPTAIRLAGMVEPLRLKWLEDPIPITNPDALAEVRARTRIPICCGEMFIAEQFRLFIDRGACDIIHPDVLFVGGLKEARKVADYADLHHLPLAMHNNGSAVATIAAAHVAAASPNFIGLEYHFFDATWIGALVRRDAPLFEEGHVRLQARPGLGFELDEEVCRRHLADGESFF